MAAITVIKRFANLLDVDLTGVQDGDAVVYEAATGMMVAGPGGGTYVFTQGSPSATWAIAHNQGRFPSVTVVDTGGSTVEPDVHYIDANSLTVQFGSPTTGKAYLN